MSLQQDPSPVKSVKSEFTPDTRPLAGLSALDTALVLLDRGFWPVAIYPAGYVLGEKKKTGKEPFGNAWGIDRWTPDRIRDAFKILGPGTGVGVCLGPGRGPNGSWLIDLEGDGPEADESRAKLFGGESVRSMGWSSTRGGHQLFSADEGRLLKILPGLKSFETKEPNKPGVYHLPNLPGLELRFGGYHEDGAVKQLQSVVPPTPGTDGRARSWNA